MPPLVCLHLHFLSCTPQVPGSRSLSATDADRPSQSFAHLKSMATVRATSCTLSICNLWLPDPSLHYAHLAQTAPGAECLKPRPQPANRWYGINQGMKRLLAAAPSRIQSAFNLPTCTMSAENPSPGESWTSLGLLGPGHLMGYMSYSWYFLYSSWPWVRGMMRSY